MASGPGRASASGSAAASEADASSPMKAVINYTRNTEKHIIVGPGGDLPLVPTDVAIHDARRAAPPVSMETHGFELLNYPTELPDDLFGDDAAVTSLYRAEVEQLIKTRTGAARVIVMHHNVRTSGLTGDHAPAPVAHCDFTPRGVGQIIESALSPDTRGRVAFINAWRSIDSGGPIERDPLVLCDGRSVTAPDDFVPVDVRDASGKINASYQLDPSLASRHRWYWFPRMTKDEVILFVQYDSDPTAASRFCFHGSMTLPGAAASARPRRSVEARAMAIFPDHGEDTLRRGPASASDVVQTGVDKIMASLTFAPHWPEAGRAWVARTIRQPHGVAAVVRGLVVSAIEKGHHGLGGASDAVRDEVIARLMAQSEAFKARALAYFPV